MSRDGAFSRAQQTKNWCVGFSFPPPAYAGIHPTLYLFGFRANALNSHSPPSLPDFLGLVSADALWDLFGAFSYLETFGASGGLRGPLDPLGASGRSFLGCRGLPGPPGASRHLRASGLVGLENPPGAFKGPPSSRRFWTKKFAFLGCRPYLRLNDFKPTSWGGQAGSPQEPQGAHPEAQGRWV